MGASAAARKGGVSSRIEGTQTTLGDVFAAEAEQLSLVQSSDVREVLNYLYAYEYGLERLATLPLSLRLIRELHDRLMAGVRGANRLPGVFRMFQNFIGGTSEANATYVPPPPAVMHDLLDDLERFMHERAMRPLVQMAVLHYQFEAIHPFAAGNGRVGRLLTGIFLHERGLLPRPLLFLSAYFERTRDAYYAGLMRVSTHGEWDAWVAYVLDAVRTQAEEAAVLADRLLALQESYRARLQRRRATVSTLALVDALFVNPVVTARRAQDLLGVSPPTARAAIGVLEQAGIVREVTKRRWGRVYRAEEIFGLFRDASE